MSSAESRLKMDRKIQRSDAASVVRPAGSEFKQGPSTRTASQAECLLAAEKRTLEMMANGASLSEVLSDLCASIDAHASPVTSMVCLMDPDRKQLMPRAGPRVPAAFKAAITPWPIGPNNGSCGTAAFTKQRVIIPDISSDPRWPDEARDLALNHGVCAAWSEPLISKDGEVLGTFCLSYAEPRIPSSRDLELIQAAAHIARIAIEGERAQAALTKAFDDIAKSEAELRTIIDAIPQLIVAIGINGNFLYANQAVLKYTGLTKEEMKLGNFREVFHSEDLERLRDQRAAALSRGVPFEYELRVRRSRDGQYRWFLVQYNPLRDERGEIIRWYATGTDIDDRKQAEERTRQETSCCESKSIRSSCLKRSWAPRPP
jgi:PAS domain S-box-containing protein